MYESEVGLRLEEVRVALADDFDRGGQLGQLFHLVRAQEDVGGGGVLLEAVQLRGAGDGNDPGLSGPAAMPMRSAPV